MYIKKNTGQILILYSGGTHLEVWTTKKKRRPNDEKIMSEKILVSGIFLGQK